MKPIFVLSLVTSALIAGFLGASVYAAFSLRRADGDTVARERLAQPRETSREGDRAADAAAVEPSDALAVAELRDQLGRLEIEVASLREVLARRAAPEPEALEAKSVGSDAVGAVNREAIVQVLEEQREQERLQRDEERKKREREAIDRIAERTAKDLGLSPADQTRLSEFMVTASDKREEMFRDARDGGSADFRATFDEYMTWRDTEIKSTFGDQLGQQLIDHTRRSRDGWMFGRGGDRGDRGEQGGGGGGQVGGARRAR
jgi:hypothetical protein